MSEENKAIAYRYLDELWNKKNEAQRGDLASFTRGAMGRAMRAAFPDIELTIEDQIAEADKVVTRCRFRGTHTGEYEGHAPTDKQVDITAIYIYRIEGGKIVERWMNWEKAGLLQQIGAIPS